MTGPVVYTPDASRAVGVATNLVSDQADAFIADLKQEYEDVRRRHANRKATPLISLAEARAAVPPSTGPSTCRRAQVHRPPRLQAATTWPRSPPISTGRRSSIPGACSARSRPSWTTRWSGEQARKVYADGQAMLKRIVEGRWLDRQRRGRASIRPIRVNDEDIEVYADDTRGRACCSPGATCASRRQARGCQQQDAWRTTSRPRTAASPTTSASFAVTAGLGIEKKEAEFAAAHDDYSSIMLKSAGGSPGRSLCRMPARARAAATCGAMRPTRSLDNADMIAEKYVGIRPAPGYPALSRTRRQDATCSRCWTRRRSPST